MTYMGKDIKFGHCEGPGHGKMIPLAADQ